MPNTTTAATTKRTRRPQNKANRILNRLARKADLPPVVKWDRGTFIPTPEQIREACLQIQSEWSPDEWHRRSRGIMTE